MQESAPKTRIYNPKTGGVRRMKLEELRETVVSKEKIFEGRILDVQKWTVSLPGGNEAFREVVLHRGASAVVPVDEDKNVYLVTQYRAPIGDLLTEIPAGKLDYAGEDRLQAAKRELREETGFTADKWTHLTDLYTTPGFSSEMISVYLAQGLKNGETDFDDDEFIDVKKLPLAEAVRMARAGEIRDGKTVAGLLLADHIVNGD